MRKLIVFLALMCAGVAAAAPAFAQGYPGDTSTTTPQSTSATVTLGTFGDGAVFTAEFCGFAPGVPVSITFNGATVGTFTAGSDGCVRLTIRVLEDGVALAQPVIAAAGLQLAQSGPQPRVSINGTEFNANRGTNTLVATGTGANGASRTVTVRFTLGAADGAGGGGGLARTGAMVLRWSLAGGALLAVGALLVLADRRRGTRPDGTA